MPVRTSLVGQSLGELRVTCDARWLMAYAGGLGLSDPCYLDTRRVGGVVAHPLFPVAPEWPLLDLRTTIADYGLGRDEARRGVHAGHALVWHRPLRQGDDVVVSGTVIGVEATPAGARVTARLDAVGAGGPAPAEAVWTTWYTTVFRGVDVDGPDVAPVDGPPPLPPAVGPAGDACDRLAVQIAPTAAHVYTECARIWNPIHTDIRTAIAAGLPGLVLHGTATLAHGITAAMAMIGAEPAAVRRVGGSFRAMVPMPSTLSVELVSVTEGTASRIAAFGVRTEDGRLAVDRAFVAVAR